ncbi:MAG TPA: hypothetical protein VHC69_10315 [Polyangiaceae bacterium]|nr:hypothetical protein [Polyangiaceae bacterium]
MIRVERLGRHLRGWQLAVVAVGTALGGVALALPRPVPPKELPLPAVDRHEEARAAARDRDRIASAREAPLPFLVRAAGDAFRRLGDAEVRGQENDADAMANAFSKRVEAARKEHGDEPVLALRAVQTDLFVTAVRRWNLSELHQLGGSFFAARDAEAATRVAELPDDELASLFEMRWSKLAGVVKERPFAPTLNEWRLYYRTLLSHAELASPKLEHDATARAASLGRVVEALAKIDPDYPASLALGVTRHWLARYDDAEALFTSYLAAHPTGAFRLRVQGYVLAARRHEPGAEAL